MNQSRYLSEVPRYATNKRFDKTLGMWTYDVPPRNLWDTHFPEEMVLMARNVSKTDNIEPDVINALHDELTRAITDSEGVQMTPMKHDVFYDAETREHFYDVSVILKTKGGWHV